MIVGLAGRMQSGKDTRCNFLHGYIMQQKGIIENFRINEDGKLIVSSLFDSPNGPELGEGILDLDNDHPRFLDYMADKVWPYVKKYSFAAALKEVCSQILGLDMKMLNGSKQDKEQLTHLMWENMPGVYTDRLMEIIYEMTDSDAIMEQLSAVAIYHSPGPMTYREVLQYVGSDIFRKINPMVWIDVVKRQIEVEQPQIAVISDCRFPEEVDWIRANGKSICLLRNSEEKPKHQSEGIETYSHDLIIDNRDLSNDETNRVFLEQLQTWGVI